MKKIGAVFGILSALVLTAYVTFILTAQFYQPMKVGGFTASAKLAEIEDYLDAYFVDDYDSAEIADAAAAAAIDATGDQWSYYIPASEYEEYEESVQNAYAGIGVYILDWDGEGFPIASIMENSPASNAGLQIGDKICSADGIDISEMEISDVQDIVKGVAGTPIELTILRENEMQSISLERALIEQTVAAGEMLTDEIGCITIANFDNNSAKQTIAAIENVLAQGAKALVFDVRMNPGGMRVELVNVLDYLLPEGDIFRGVSTDGFESVDRSDPSCVSLPMVVLVDKNTYSAAEFFAAVLQEKEWATIVGEHTSGKGNYQHTFPLSDGSAIAISVGKYFMPSGRSLDGVGITPDVLLSLQDEQLTELYYGILAPEDDAQLQRAIEILTKKNLLTQ